MDLAVIIAIVATAGIVVTVAAVLYLMALDLRES